MIQPKKDRKNNTPFWMTAGSHPLFMFTITSMSEDECRAMLTHMRWGSASTQICPKCGTIDSHYHIKSRRQWRCKSQGCGHTFSVLSGTPFENSKMGYRRLLMAMVAFIVNQKGISALALSRIIGLLPGYKHLVGEGYIHETVNHSIEFSTDDGINKNQAESYFSRLRRAIIGQFHRVTPKYMLDYAQEMAWREDVRRKDTFMQLRLLVRKVLASGVSADWFNYGRRGFGRQAVFV